jgi:nucleoside-diphosphate-sugar epimerase
MLIAGCGDVGTTVGIELAGAGHQVWGLRRRPEGLPAPLQPLAADLTNPASLKHLPPALDFVFYTAAADGFDEARYRAVYVDGVHNLLIALQETGQHPRRVFMISSTSVYAQHQGEWVDEMSPAGSVQFPGRLIREGEERVWNSPYPGTVVRFAGIYGPGRTRLLDSVRGGNATCVPGLYTNRIHRDDGAAILRFLMTLPEAAPLYIGVDDTPALQCEVLAWLAARLGMPGPRSITAADRVEAALRANKRCSNARLRAAGFSFRYPSYREGYTALLRDYSARPDGPGGPA